MQVHRGIRRRNRRPWQLIVDIAAAIFLITLIFYQVRFLAIQLHSPQTQNSSISAAAGRTNPQDLASLQLGFPYPQLAKARSLASSLLIQQEQKHISWTELTAEYGAALHALTRDHNTTSTAARASDREPANSILQKFLQEAFSLVSADSGLLHCAADATLLEAWHATKAAAATPQASAETASHAKALQARRYLLAANFHNSAAVLPNFIVQTLRLALLLPQGHLAVSLYESASSDTSRMWLTLLHQMLLPLGAPNHITAGGDLSPRLQLGRIELLAALRNALLEPWMPQRKQQPQQQKQQPQSQSHQQRAHDGSQPSWLRQAWAHHDARGSPARAAAAGFAVLKHSPDQFMPDTLLFANDVFFCAEDLLRLIMHDADIACGMDFYTAPWQQQQQQVGLSAAALSSSKGDSSSAIHEKAGEKAELVNTMQNSNAEQLHYKANDKIADGTADKGQGSSHSGTVSDITDNSNNDDDDDDDDDFFDPDSGQLQQGSAAASTAGHGSLRFYDKWVARDQAGGRLRNRAPFIQHPPSQALLAAGQPVAMRCCWNGLAAVTAAPFVAGLRFRRHQPGECQASECSLMCDDLARLGFTHVVMDPAIRLAYELEQLPSLGAAAAPLAAATQDKNAHAAIDATQTAAVHDVAGLGPRLPWKEVATASQRLAAAAAVRSGTRAAAAAGLVECCDLQLGKSYVNFRQDCHMMDVMAHNYTAHMFAA